MPALEQQQTGLRPCFTLPSDFADEDWEQSGIMVPWCHGAMQLLVPAESDHLGASKTGLLNLSESPAACGLWLAFLVVWLFGFPILSKFQR